MRVSQKRPGSERCNCGGALSRRSESQTGYGTKIDMAQGVQYIKLAAQNRNLRAIWQLAELNYDIISNDFFKYSGIRKIRSLNSESLSELTSNFPTAIFFDSKFSELRKLFLYYIFYIHKIFGCFKISVSFNTAVSFMSSLEFVVCCTSKSHKIFEISTKIISFSKFEPNFRYFTPKFPTCHF